MWLLLVSYLLACCLALDCSSTIPILDLTSMATNDTYTQLTVPATINVNWNTGSVSALTLTVTIIAPYIGEATSDFGDRTVTYVIGTEPFPSSGQSIQAPSACQNSLGSSFANLTIAESFGYSTDPEASNALGTTDYLSYGPQGAFWTVAFTPDTSDPSNCGLVEYTGTFLFTEWISQCDAVQMQQDTDWFHFTGAFYLSVVARGPTDASYYSITVVSLPVRIAFRKLLSVVSSFEGIFEFAMASASGLNSPNTAPNQAKLEFVTAVRSFIRLTNPVWANAADYGIMSYTMTPSTPGSCNLMSTHHCVQVWTLTFDAECQQVNQATDYSGDYDFVFDFECNDAFAGGDMSACQDYIDFQDVVQTPIALTADVAWTTTCNVSLDIGSLSGTMSFYSNSAFTTPLSTARIDQQVFIEVNLNDGDSTDELFQLQWKRVCVCSSDLNAQVTSCFDDADVYQGNDTFHCGIPGGNADTQISPMVDHSGSSTTTQLRASFTVPALVGDLMWVHAVVEAESLFTSEKQRLDIHADLSASKYRVNRRWLQSENLQTIASAVGGITLSASALQESDGNQKWIVIVVSAVGGVAVLAVLSFLGYYYYCKNGSNKAEKNESDQAQTMNP